MDGCSAHKISANLAKECEGVLKIINLPTHSSHLLQPFDLGIFSVQKRIQNKNKLELPDGVKPDKQKVGRSYGIVKICPKFAKSS